MSGPPYSYEEYLPSSTPSTADGLAMVVDLIGYFVAKNAEKRAMDNLMPAVNIKMPSDGGVLVGLRYQRRDDDVGPRFFMFAWIIGAGHSPSFIFKNQSSSTASTSLMPSYVKEDEYLWITKHSKH